MIKMLKTIWNRFWMKNTNQKDIPDNPVLSSIKVTSVLDLPRHPSTGSKGQLLATELARWFGECNVDTFDVDVVELDIGTLHFEFVVIHSHDEQGNWYACPLLLVGAWDHDHETHPRLEHELKTRYTAKEITLCAKIIVPGNMWACADWSEKARQLGFYATSAVSDMMSSDGLALADLGLSDLCVQIKPCGNQTDLFGRPIRAEVVLESSLQERGSAHAPDALRLQQAPVRFYDVYGYFDIVKPEEGDVPVQPMKFVVTKIAGHLNVESLATALMALATVGALTNSAADECLYRLTAIHRSHAQSDMAFSLDCRLYGENSWIMETFYAAAEGNQKAIDLLTETAKSLTDGYYSPAFVGKYPMISETVLSVEDGLPSCFVSLSPLFLHQMWSSFFESGMRIAVSSDLTCVKEKPVSTKRVSNPALLRSGDRLIVPPAGGVCVSGLDPKVGTLAPGTIVIVQPIETYEFYVDRDKTTSHWQHPGKYMKHDVESLLFTKVGSDPSVIMRLDFEELIFEDSNINLDDRKNDQDWFNLARGVYVAPLPKMPFYVGDHVSATYSDGEKRVTTIGVIHRVNFENLNRLADDGSILPLFEYRETRPGWLGNATLPHLPNNSLRLIKRGNYYWWEHDKSKLQFMDIHEECQFYKSLRYAEQQLTPDGSYTWTYKDALVAVARGEVDFIETMLHDLALFLHMDDGAQVTAWRFRDDGMLNGLATRLRHLTLGGEP